MSKRNSELRACSNPINQPRVKSSDNLSSVKLTNEIISSVNIDSNKVQGFRLGDEQLPNVQRRALAAQIGERQGNQYLQRVIVSLKRDCGQGAGQVSDVIMRQTRPAASNRDDINESQHDPGAIQVSDAPPEIVRTMGPEGYFMIDPEREAFTLLPTGNISKEYLFSEARRHGLPVFQYTPGIGPSFAEAVAENQPQVIDNLVRWMGYANLEVAELGGRSGGVPTGQSPDGEGSRLGQSIYLIMSILDMGAAAAIKGVLRRFVRRAIPALRRAARRTGLRGLDAVADNLERRLSQTQSAVHGGERILWGRWEDYPHVIIKGKQYAHIRGRLYTQHAVDRMQPSRNSWARPRLAPDAQGTGRGRGTGGQPEIRIEGRDYGRGVSPENVEQVISTGTRTRQAKGRTSILSGSVEVITEAFGNNPEGIVVTIILH